MEHQFTKSVSASSTDAGLIYQAESGSGKGISIVTTILLIWFVSVGAMAIPLNSVPSFQKVLKGVVLDENGEPLPGTSIYLKGTTKGIVADEKGRFEFPEELSEGDTLVFSYVGYETTEYVITSATPDFLEISLDMFTGITGELQCVSLKKNFWSRLSRIFE